MGWFHITPLTGGSEKDIEAQVKEREGMECNAPCLVVYIPVNKAGETGSQDGARGDGQTSRPNFGLNYRNVLNPPLDV